MANEFFSHEAFNEGLAQAVQETLKHDYDIDAVVTAQTVLKTNGLHSGICVHKEGSSIAPTIYTEADFARYQEGTPFEEVVESVSGVAVQALEHQIDLPELTIEEAKKHIILTLVNTERNQELLKAVPHFEVGDLSAIPRWQINEEMSFVVKSDMAASMQLTPDEVLCIGQKNIDSEDFIIDTMQHILRARMIESGMSEEMLDAMLPDEDSSPKMLVISSQNGAQGARAILQEKTLAHVHEMLGGDFVILPSSIHEVICISAEGTTPRDLKAMVHEVNSTVVNAEDFLSDSPMICDGHKIRLFMEEPKLEPQKLDERKIHYAGMKM